MGVNQGLGLPGPDDGHDRIELWDALGRRVLATVLVPSVEPAYDVINYDGKIFVPQARAIAVKQKYVQAKVYTAMRRAV